MEAGKKSFPDGSERLLHLAIPKPENGAKNREEDHVRKGNYFHPLL